MKFNKNVLIAILLLSVFAVGTLNFVDTVEAAKWKKYDSGKYTDEYPVAGYKKVASYQSYTKGDNSLYVNIYAYSKKTGKKKLAEKMTLTKKNNILKIVDKNYFSNEKRTMYFETKFSVKTLYKSVAKEAIKDSGISPEKKASDKQSFTVNNATFNVYGIKDSKEYMEVYVYKNGEIYSCFAVEYVYYEEYNNKRIENKNIYREYDQKGKLVSMETFKKSQSISSIYKTKLNKLINKIKSS